MVYVMLSWDAPSATNMCKQADNINTKKKIEVFQTTTAWGLENLILFVACNMAHLLKMFIALHSFFSMVSASSFGTTQVWAVKLSGQGGDSWLERESFLFSSNITILKLYNS